MHHKLLATLFILFSNVLYAQYYLKIVDTENNETLKINAPSKSISREERSKNIESVLGFLREKGHLLATADSMVEKGDSIWVYLTKGPKYYWSKLFPIQVDEAALRNAGYKQGLFINQPLKYKQAGKLLNRILVWYEDNGYPFVRIKLDSIKLVEQFLSAGIRVDPGDQFTIDSITIKGDATINPTYIYNYLGIKPGDIYNESSISQINIRMRELPFVSQTKPADVFLVAKSALIKLHLNQKKASNFNGIIGFLPNSVYNTKLLITGEATLKLRNGLGRGESIDAEWRRLQVGTQSVNLGVSWPFIFNTPFGVSGNLSLFKKDTSFLSLKYNLGFQYLMKGSNYLKVYTESRGSSLLSTKGLAYITKLPDFADIRTTLYGLEFNYTKLDYRFNPRKGFRAILQGAAGKRKISKNPALNPEIYENLNLNSLQLNASIDADVFLPLFKRATFNIGLMGNWLESPELFENELPRIGGINSLRGFNEESIWASSYSILNLEYRYLLEENSFLFLFWNGAWYENRAINRNIHDYPYGFGAGMCFETRAGLFSISYALGREFNNPIQFRSAKIHFGITGLF